MVKNCFHFFTSYLLYFKKLFLLLWLLFFKEQNLLMISFKKAPQIVSHFKATTKTQSQIGFFTRGCSRSSRTAFIVTILHILTELRVVI